MSIFTKHTLLRNRTLANVALTYGAKLQPRSSFRSNMLYSHGTYPDTVTSVLVEEFTANCAIRLRDNLGATLFDVFSRTWMCSGFLLRQQLKLLSLSTYPLANYCGAVVLEQASCDQHHFLDFLVGSLTPNLTTATCGEVSAITATVGVPGQPSALQLTAQGRISGGNFSFNAYPHTTATRQQDIAGDSIWPLITYYIGSALVSPQPLSLTPALDNLGKMLHALTNFSTITSELTLRAVGCLGELHSVSASLGVNLIWYGSGMQLMRESLNSRYGYSIYSLFNDVAVQIPQIFQIRFYALNRRLRKILKNSNKYRRVFSYVMPAKRQRVLGRFLYPFFKFADNRSYQHRVQITIAGVLSQTPTTSTAWLIYQKQQIGVLSALLQKGS